MNERVMTKFECTESFASKGTNVACLFSVISIACKSDCRLTVPYSMYECEK